MRLAPKLSAYNGLLQPCLMDANNNGTLLQTCNDSTPSGNVLDLAMNYNFGSSDNGNVVNWNATGSQSSIRTYSYDALNRLSTMADSVQSQSCRGLSWSYDQWGNRTAQNVTAGTCGSSQLTFNSYNHVTNSGFQYDAAGNMTHDASHSYTYDAENRITQVDGGSTAAFAYGADGRRVSKTAGGSQMNYLYDLSGQVISEFNASSWQNIYLRLNGALFAQYSVSPYRTQFIHLDHLGSTRLLTGYPTASVLECDDYYPFGELTACGGTSTTTHKFTGYERDTESGLDNAQARYNSSAMGRFMSPDPIGNFVADATNPQTWNMYTYVNNNPLAFVDPTGTDPSTCEWSNPAACIADNNLGEPSIPFPCDVQSGCIAYVNGNPPWEIDPSPPYFPPVNQPAGPIGSSGGGGSTCYYALASPCGAPQTPQSPGQTPQQKYDSCMASFNSSTVGKVAHYGSVLSFTDNFVSTAENWIEAIAVKGATLGAFFNGANYAAGGVSPVTATVKPIVADAATGGIMLATGVDAAARSGCFYGANPDLNPFMNNGLGGPIF
jgi:RHS repeat-associated protein